MRHITAAILLIGLFRAALGQAECPEPNGYYPDPKRCDTYVECRDGVGTVQTCPDGLIVNEKAAAFRHPCEYPVDSDCGSRTLPPAQPVGNCQRRWGMFGVGDRTNCGDFVNCVDGTEFRFSCPEGLAWDPVTWRCEWADKVAACDAEAFLGFRCPSVEKSGAGSIAESRFQHASDCARFFVCGTENRPRLVVCASGHVYNPLTKSCDEAENVPGCETYYKAK